MGGFAKGRLLFGNACGGVFGGVLGAGNLVFGVFAGGGLGLFGLAGSGKLAGAGLGLFGPRSFGVPARLAAIGLVAGLATGFAAGWRKRVRGSKVATEPLNFGAIAAPTPATQALAVSATGLRYGQAWRARGVDVHCMMWTQCA